MAKTPKNEQDVEPVESPGADDAAGVDRAAAGDEPLRFEMPDDAVAALRAERDELYERLQRVSADYQNYMKRSAQNLQDGIELARGEMLKRLIPVLDHFDQALAQEPQGEEARSLHDGLRIVRDELLRVMNAEGVARIEPQVNEPFDPNLHEAMLHQPVAGVEPNHVSLVMQPGYVLGNRTLRPAKVAVAPGTPKPPADGSAPDAADSGDGEA